MASSNLGPIDVKRLTPQQAKFLELVLGGTGLSAAYRKAYRCARSAPHTVRTAAWKLARRHAVVAPMLEAEMAARLRCAQERGQQLRQRIEERLVELLGHPDPRIVLKAAKLAGELSHVGAYDASRQRDEPGVADALQTLAEIERLCATDDEASPSLEDGGAGGAVTLGVLIDTGE